jgi:hypothetical protein
VSLLGGAFRGVRRRAGVSVGILLVATVATVASAAAAAGPTYDAAARASILQDNLHQSPILRTVEADDSGPVAGLAGNLGAEVTSVLAAQLGGRAVLNRLFQPPVEAILAQVSTGNHLTPLTWRTDECGYLRLTAGFCPRGAGHGGREFLVVGKDGTVTLPPDLLDEFPPGSLAIASRTERGVLLRRVDPGAVGDEEEA